MEKSTILNRSKELRKRMTEEEQKLWKVLRNRNLLGYKFRRQQPMTSYITDFICFEVKLVVELDGQHHQQQYAYDNKRTRFLNGQDFVVLRFWNKEVRTDFDNVKRAIAGKLNELAEKKKL